MVFKPLPDPEKKRIPLYTKRLEIKLESHDHIQLAAFEDCIKLAVQRMRLKQKKHHGHGEDVPVEKYVWVHYFCITSLM